VNVKAKYHFGGWKHANCQLAKHAWQSGTGKLKRKEKEKGKEKEPVVESYEDEERHSE
jgi:hypothetical protein